MNLPNWEKLTRTEQERVVGRDIATGQGIGSPGALDFNATTILPSESHTHGDGKVETHKDIEVIAIAPDAHVRRAHPSFNDGAAIYRRGYSYDTTSAKGQSDRGLIFVAFGASTEAFTTIQKSLSQKDALHRWLTHIGSAEFAILPGAREGSWLGSELFADQPQSVTAFS